MKCRLPWAALSRPCVAEWQLLLPAGHAPKQAGDEQRSALHPPASPADTGLVFAKRSGIDRIGEMRAPRTCGLPFPLLLAHREGAAGQQILRRRKTPALLPAYAVTAPRSISGHADLPTFEQIHVGAR